MPGMQDEAAEKIDAGLRAALSSWDPLIQVARKLCRQLQQ